MLIFTFSNYFAGCLVYGAVEPLPAETIDGINYIDDSTVVLVLLAPGKDSAKVTGSFNNWTQWKMNKTPDGERFWIQLDSLIPGQEYIYQYVVDGNIRIADPFAEKILDPWNDKYISDIIYPNLIEYKDTEKGIASVFQTEQQEYDWQVDDFQGPPKQELVIYELLIRDFKKEHSFQSVIDAIPYLKGLGINAIELLPVNEFDANISWGYNPAFYFAADKYYGPKEKLQELVDVAHQNGIAVILDMVYNHSMNSHPLVQLYWDSQNNRPAADNPWYNTTAPHTCIGWGNDFNHESQYTRDFFDRVNKFWLEEYKVDGFRFDFTKGFTQKQTAPRWVGDGDCGASEYDTSRVNNIKRMADELWKVKDDAYIILEHWTEATEEDELTSYGNGMLTWRRVDHQYKEVISGHQLSIQSFGAAQSDSRVVFMESHDENRIMVQCHNYGNNHSSGYNIKSTPTALDRVAQGAAFLYTIPGPKMVWMFGELGFDYDINYCIDDGEIREGCRTGLKPLMLTEYLGEQDRVDLYNTISELLKLREEFPVFTQGNYEIDENGNGIVNDGIGPLRQIRFKDSQTMDVVIMGNFGVEGGNINPWFTKNGTWYNYFNDSEYEYTGQSSYFLEPGQWALFSSESIRNIIYAPTNLSVEVTGDDVSISWTETATKESGYQVERSTSVSGGFSLIQTLGENATSFVDSNREDGLYYYRVRATDGDSLFSKYSNIVEVRVGQPASFDVYFRNTANWSQVNIYLFDKITNTALQGWSWPGVPIPKENDSSWYVYTINEYDEVGIVFNNNNDQQTDDLFRTSEGWYDFRTKKWYDECPGGCDTSSLPYLSVSPPGGTYEDSVTVTLLVTKNGDIKYSTDGSDPEDGLPYSEKLIFKSKTRLRAIASNQEGNSKEIDETYSIVESQCDTIFYYNKNNWGNVYIYLFNANGNELTGWKWHGVKMTRVGKSKWYYYRNCENVDVGIVFNNGSGDQTDDLFSNKGWYYSDGKWYQSCPAECKDVENPEGLTLHCKKPDEWSTVYLYFWNTTGATLTTTWPGILMDDSDGDGWYTYTLEEVECSNVIFNNNGQPQTEDLMNICKESWYDNGWVDNPNPTSIDLNNFEPGLKKMPYPNPFSDKLNFIIDEIDTEVYIELLDLKGRVIYNDSVNSTKEIIVLQPGVPNGIYILHVTTKTNVFTYKVMKQ